MRLPFLNTKIFFSAILWLIFSLGNLLFSQEKKDSLVTAGATKQIQDSSIVKENLPEKDSTSKKNVAVKIPSAFKLDSLENLVRLDSLGKKKLLKKLIPQTHGTISAGYDYGIIPFAANVKYPMGYYSSQGNVSLTALGLPLNTSYYYSSLKNIAGLNNYFRVSFDAAAYRETLKNKGFKTLEAEKNKLSEYLNLQQLLQQKLTYAELLKQDMPSPAALTSKLQDYQTKYIQNQYNQVKDSLQNDLTKNPLGALNNLDTLNKSTNISKIKIPPYADSIAFLTDKIRKYDSVVNTINQYKEKLETIQKQVNSINSKINYLTNPQQAVQENPKFKKYEQLLSGVKKLDIGLSYPNYSTFLVSGSTIKGINIEWQKKLYFAFTYGKTINTIMTTNNLIQNQLQTARNFYNFFDFGNVRDSRKILAMKFGVGAKESTHFHIGFLYGVGMPSYLSTPIQSNMEKNLVLELDGKVALNKNNSIDLVYGKSAIYENGFIQSPDESLTQNLFSKFRSNAALIRYNGQIERTKTKITLTGRMIDPFFNSYGVGFLRSDNLRYEIKIDQALGNKIKFSGFYRNDRDNLLSTFLYTNSLQTRGANLTVKVNRRFTARVSYSPVVQNTVSRDSAAHNTSHVNTITNAVLTYAPRFKSVSSFFNAMYSRYELLGNAGNNNYQNYNISNTTIFNSLLKMDLAGNYFFNNSHDSLNSNTAMVSGNVSFSMKNGGFITLGTKYANNTLVKNQVGGLLKINIPLVKYINIEFEAQRLVLGDFYNSYNLKAIKEFPYYGYGKVIFQW